MYLVNQQIMLGEPVIFKNQKDRKNQVKWHKSLDSYIHQKEKTAGIATISEIVLFDSLSNKQRATKKTIDICR